MKWQRLIRRVIFQSDVDIQVELKLNRTTKELKVSLEWIYRSETLKWNNFNLRRTTLSDQWPLPQCLFISIFLFYKIYKLISFPPISNYCFHSNPTFLLQIKFEFIFENHLSALNFYKNFLFVQVQKLK